MKPSEKQKELLLLNESKTKAIEINKIVEAIDSFHNWRKSNENVQGLKKKYYNGYVYCAEVDNSILVTRRNYKILISGNSCVGNGVASALEYLDFLDGNYTDKSRLFIYYGAREIGGYADQDCGCQIRNAIKFVASPGCCDEKFWPYDVSKVLVKPDTLSYINAKTRAIEYSRVKNSQGIKYALASVFHLRRDIGQNLY